MRTVEVCAVAILLGCGVRTEAQEESARFQVQVPVAEAVGSDVRPLADFMIPTQGGPEESALRERCAAGEDVRHLFSPAYAILEIDRKQIRLSGEPVLRLYGFVPQDKDVRGQMLVPLAEQAELVVAYIRRHPRPHGGCWPEFDGKLLIALHPDTPFSILRKVMYTMGQAQFSEFAFLVSDPEAVRARKGESAPSSAPVAPPDAQPDEVAESGPGSLANGLKGLGSGLVISGFDDRCHDLISIVMLPDGGLQLAAKPFHGGAVREGLDNLKSRLISAQGRPDIAGLEAWLSTVTAPAQPGQTRAIECLVQPAANTPAGQILAVARAAYSALPDASITYSNLADRGSEVGVTPVTPWPQVLLPPMGAQDWVAVQQSTLPEIQTPGRDYYCKGADGMRYLDPLRKPTRHTPVPPPWRCSFITGGLEPGPYVRLEKPPGEYADQICAVIKKKGQILYCYERVLQDNPGIEGRLQLGLEISGGRVTSAKVVLNDTGVEALESCVLAKARRWRFPADVQGSILLPFDLLPYDPFAPSNDPFK